MKTEMICLNTTCGKTYLNEVNFREEKPCQYHSGTFVFASTKVIY